MSMSLQFLGAAGTVTGSRHLLQIGERRILVDCGLFQGLKELRLQNRLPFPVEPASIDAVILTHAHLDHSGNIPLFVDQGFRGPIFCTPPTRALAKILLADAAHIEEEDAEYSNKKGFSKHSPALPLFTVEQAYSALRNFTELNFNTWADIFPGIRIRLSNSGHILGSAFVEVEAEGMRVVFSGDLGRTVPLTLLPREELRMADVLVVESTYGDRLHPVEDPLDALQRVILETVEKKGHLLIPSFAVGRTQDLLFLLSKLKRDSRIPAIPVYLDSPLATGATDIYLANRQWQRLSEQELRELSTAAVVMKSRQESKELLHARGSTIVIAGSGMVSGGRILHHLANRISDPRNTVLLVGYQAPGTRGALLHSGASEIKMHGRYFPVRAAVRELSGLSAHADQAEILNWLRCFEHAPGQVFLVHGEPQPADFLRLKLKDTLGWPSQIPKQFEKFELKKA